MDAAIEHASAVAVVSLCAALGLSRASLYRRKSGRGHVVVRDRVPEGATAPRILSDTCTDGDAARNDTALVAALPTALVRRSSPRALSVEERKRVLDELHSERFVDLAPAEVYATLLDEGRYLCSERTMYRILDDSREVRERRDQLRHPAYAAPQLLAERPTAFSLTLDAGAYCDVFRSTLRLPLFPPAPP